MTISIRYLVKNTMWTVGAYGLGQALRLVTNIILARLLAPQLFGILFIVNSLRLGIEFISDVGIGQNIVYHKNANDPEFYNTAWTLQAIRGIGIWFVALILAVPIARFYEIPILVFLVPLMSFASVLAGFSSISLSLVQKRLLVARLNAFDLIMAFIGSAAILLFAYISPTVWALVFGFLFGCTSSMVGTYFLLPDVKLRFYLSKQYVWEILHYGKWVFAASIAYFLSNNFDRLYLAKAVSLEQLGVYGIARSMADVLGGTVARFGNFVLFPFIASHSHMPRSEFRRQLASVRAKFLLLAGVVFSLITVVADLPIKFLYDERYQAAAWMLPLLVIGSWFSLLANVNESKLLGLGKPSYSAIANSSKFIFLLIGLPLGVMVFGLLGGIVVVTLSDLFRYFPILWGERREHFSFGAQDLVITLAVFLLIGLGEWLRWLSGFGYSFESLPIEIGTLFSGNRS
jgi:O-antigen/teichoic acid export membrane protein